MICILMEGTMKQKILTIEILDLLNYRCKECKRKTDSFGCFAVFILPRGGAVLCRSL